MLFLFHETKCNYCNSSKGRNIRPISKQTLEAGKMRKTEQGNAKGSQLFYFFFIFSRGELNSRPLKYNQNINLIYHLHTTFDHEATNNRTY